MTVQNFQIRHFSQLWETVLHNFALASLKFTELIRAHCTFCHLVSFFCLHESTAILDQMYTSTCLPSNLFREFSWQEPTCDGVLLFVTCFHIQMFKQTCRHYQSFRFMISITDFRPLWVGTIQFNLVSKLWHFLIILRPRACSVNTLSQILLLVMESVSCLFFLIFFFYAIKVI